MTNIHSYKTDEKSRSQLPALRVLRALGYEYIPTQTAMQYRHNKTHNVLLETVLYDNLNRLNTFTAHGTEYKFNDTALNNAIDKLKSVTADNFIAQAQEKWELLRLGTTEPQTTNGDRKDRSLKYIDWDNIQNNRFHMVAEYKVHRTKANGHYVPDIVVFVNGIPMGVIECKAPSVDVKDGIDQHIRNQKADGIRDLYAFTQIAMALNAHSAHTASNDFSAEYATTGTTDRKYWAKWKTTPISESEIAEYVNAYCPPDMFADVGISTATTPQTPTQQDKSIVSLLHPERLLKMVRGAIVHDGGTKKIARYQQYGAVEKILHRIRHIENGKRNGGVIWHTQGSGKSLTMVMTAMAIADSKHIKDAKIIIVTDRIDLDDQIHKTFASCGYQNHELHKAKNGKDLRQTIQAGKARVITTLVHKFRSVNAKNYTNDSPNIFVMIDEAHRSQYGEMHQYMKSVFPNACYLGFTGTPLMTQDKMNTYAKFGGLIDQYTIDQAINDKAIVELLYEGRMADINIIEPSTIDKWFDRITTDLTPEQKADLKHKYNKSGILDSTDSRIELIAYDIHNHFMETIRPRGFKGQLVAPNRTTAIKYQQAFERINKRITDEQKLHLKTRVVITLDDPRKDDAPNAHTEPDNIVQQFGKQMIDRHGDAERYAKETTDYFKNITDIHSPLYTDLVIVVDKLLTGFDVPANAVLYIDKPLKGHNLLQAIARVNRLYDGKEYGLIIDYRGLFAELNESLNTYTALRDFDADDLKRTLANMDEKITHLATLYHKLNDMFKGCNASEQYYEQVQDEHDRQDFYKTVTEYAKTLNLALSMDSFRNTHNTAQIETYKHALRKYSKLKLECMQHYAERIDYEKYRADIERLINKSITADDIFITHEQQFLDISNPDHMNKIKDDKQKSDKVKADTIAHNIQAHITENMEQDKAFYENFSQIIQNLIEKYKNKQLNADESDEYLRQATEIRDNVVNRRDDDVPPEISDNRICATVYRNTKTILTKYDIITPDILITAVIGLTAVMQPYRQMVNLPKNIDMHKQLRLKIDDYIYDALEQKYDFKMDYADSEKIQQTICHIAIHNIKNHD